MSAPPCLNPATAALTAHLIFAGPFPKNALGEAVKFLRSKAFVNQDKIMLYGVSRGAIAASMLATTDSQLAGVILIGGIYDLKRGFPTGPKGA